MVAREKFRVNVAEDDEIILEELFCRGKCREVGGVFATCDTGIALEEYALELNASVAQQ